MGVLVLLCVFLFVKIEPSSNQINRALPLRSKFQHMDAFGTLVFLGSISSLLLALQWGGQKFQWHDPKIIGLFVSFGGLAVIFCILQWTRGEFATIPVRVVKKRSIYMGAFVLFFLGASSLTVSATLTRDYANSCSEILTTFSVCILSTNILPINSRCLGNIQWRSIYCPRTSTNCWACRHRGDCITMGFLCKSADLEYE